MWAGPPQRHLHGPLVGAGWRAPERSLASSRRAPAPTVLRWQNICREIESTSWGSPKKRFSACPTLAVPTRGETRLFIARRTTRTDELTPCAALSYGEYRISAGETCSSSISAQGSPRTLVSGGGGSPLQRSGPLAREHNGREMRKIVSIVSSCSTPVAWSHLTWGEAPDRPSHLAGPAAASRLKRPCVASSTSATKKCQVTSHQDPGVRDHFGESEDLVNHLTSARTPALGVAVDRGTCGRTWLKRPRSR